ncbi:MAG: hypothetical protein HOK88_03555 [Candidatus Marinimicrobia bacterium]|jgi:hypothetical protein|nr:hypothetical protein [Candidatus Neomarinimicrobiota bacterium]MBT4318401.1 hypothetical protein [Candidatus Neomarinimicrobiota bacterium]MBT4785452.1 hypothetical protein [Candidatus Neomarinimicrobiota bacterium]MBT5440386.1 hypothetical protein [Candidatus Neomarinimicrobiota bacterium]MBT7423602.1 hypothetical protein [Candidatus Neomarinimicrobiota bacterium]|tara:strand:- start:1202 stop:1378 length:177 start_codon:yes stop_codon:yes gene_type:complete
MLSRVFLIKQGKCCGNGCLMCPYTNRHSGQSNKIKKEVLNNLEKWESLALKNVKLKSE